LAARLVLAVFILPVRGGRSVLASLDGPAVSYTLFAADAATALTRQLADLVQQNNLPSAAVGVFVPGKGQYTFVEGAADLQTHARRTLDQPFRIASITKPFAATAILVLTSTTTSWPALCSPSPVKTSAP
jgi:CubicO group peptidase (beta-lactamase class C family)